MKSPLLAVLIALQLITLGLVVGLLVQGNGSGKDATSRRLDELMARVDGAVNQERQIVGVLDLIRRDMAAVRASGPDSPGFEPDTSAAAPGGTSKVAGSVDASAASPFPEASAALTRLKEGWSHWRHAAEEKEQNIGPIKSNVDQLRTALLARGEQALYVVGNEIDLQPFEAGRDIAFITYLLDECVPALSGAAKEEAFRIARSALVRATNEAPIKFAAAKALQQIDSRRWVKEVLDVASVSAGPNDVGIRAQLLGLFIDNPRPEAVDVLKRFLEDARYPLELRTKAVTVLAHQDGGAVNPCLRRILFEDSAPLLKNLALDGLCDRLTDPADRKKLLDDVLAEDPARMPAVVLEKARKMREQLGE